MSELQFGLIQNELWRVEWVIIARPAVLHG